MFNKFLGEDDKNRIVVVGDIHGDLNQLIYPLVYFMKNFDKCKKIIYLGDFIDRGESNVYIYEILKKLISIREFKNKMIFLRGNHESYDYGVYDYMNMNVDELNKSDSFIKTFMFDKFHDLDFDIIHYDEDKNIVFSHSPISRNINDVIKLNDMKKNNTVMIENTYTNERENKNMTYRNIHGHDHIMSSIVDIGNFMNGNKKMISLDGDASYGIKLVQNAYKKTSRWTENISSNVKYLIMYDDDRFELIEKDVVYQSNEDFNTKSFDYIKQYLVRQSKKISLIHDSFVSLNLNESLNKFKDSYVKIFKDDPKMKSVLINIKKLYESNIKKRKSMNIYFHDVPFEIYQMIGIFRSMNFMPIYKLYWFNVLNFSDKINDINKRYKIENAVSNRLNDYIIQTIVLILTVVVVIIIISVISHSVSNMKHKLYTTLSSSNMKHKLYTTLSSSNINT